MKLTNSDADTAGSAAIIRGAEGVPVRYITSLAYDYRKDGRCSKTDPRWTLFIPATPEEWAAIQDPVEAAP